MNTKFEIYFLPTNSFYYITNFIYFYFKHFEVFFLTIKTLEVECIKSTHYKKKQVISYTQLSYIISLLLYLFFPAYKYETSYISFFPSIYAYFFIEATLLYYKLFFLYIFFSPMDQEVGSILNFLEDKTILVIGATGFLAKSMYALPLSPSS